MKGLTGFRVAAGVAAVAVGVSLVSCGSGPATPDYRALSSSGFTIDVPVGWPVHDATGAQCVEETRYGVFIGTFSALIQCGILDPTTPVLEFGHGGPPISPIPSSYPLMETINGVRVLTLRGSDSLDPPFSYALLASLDGWNNWLLYWAPGRSERMALAAGIRVLDSVRASPSVKPAHFADGSFRGVWFVHDASLTVDDQSSGRMTYRSQCPPPDDSGACAGVMTLRFQRSQEGSLQAVVAKVLATDQDGHEFVNPSLADGPAVGDRYEMEFAGPGLFIQIDLHSKWDEGDIGNPWWCNSAREEMGGDGPYYCGL